MFASIPFQIDASWHPTLGPRLAGFPANICFGKITEDEGGNIHLIKATYSPDPQSFTENDQQKQMTYNQDGPSSYRIVVVCMKQSGAWQTEKYRGNQLVGLAEGPNFNSAMAHTTMGGPAEDEGVEIGYIPGPASR